MKMNSKYRFMYDASAFARVIAKDGVAKTETFSSPEKDLDLLHGYWTSAYKETADQSLAVVINVTAGGADSSETAILTLDTVEGDDEITIDDGVNDPVTFIADTDFDVGADDEETAANLADAINDSDLNVTALAEDETVTITNLNESGLAFTGASATITAGAVAGGDETYALAIATNNDVVIGRAKVTGPGQYVVLLDMGTVKLSDPDADAIKIVGTLEGEAPSITLHAWLCGVQK